MAALQTPWYNKTVEALQLNGKGKTHTAGIRQGCAHAHRVPWQRARSDHRKIPLIPCAQAPAKLFEFFLIFPSSRNAQTSERSML